MKRDGRGELVLAARLEDDTGTGSAKRRCWSLFDLNVSFLFRVVSVISAGGN